MGLDGKIGRAGGPDAVNARKVECALIAVQRESGPVIKRLRLIAGGIALAWVEVDRSYKIITKCVRVRCIDLANDPDCSIRRVKRRAIRGERQGIVTQVYGFADGKIDTARALIVACQRKNMDKGPVAGCIGVKRIGNLAIG